MPASYTSHSTLGIPFKKGDNDGGMRLLSQGWMVWSRMWHCTWGWNHLLKSSFLFFLKHVDILSSFAFTLELVCGNYIAWNEGSSFQIKGDGNRISKAFIWCPASSCTGESFSRFWARWCYDWEGMNNIQLSCYCLGVTGRGRSVWVQSATLWCG